MNRKTAILLCCMAILALVASYSLGGGLGFYGMSVGLVFGLINMALLWGVTYFVGKAMGSERMAKLSGGLVVFAIFAKVPVYALGYVLIERVGGAALGGFLAAVGLVYCVTIGLAVARG